MGLLFALQLSSCCKAPLLHFSSFTWICVLGQPSERALPDGFVSSIRPFSPSLLLLDVTQHHPRSLWNTSWSHSVQTDQTWSVNHKPIAVYYNLNHCRLGYGLAEMSFKLKQRRRLLVKFMEVQQARRDKQRQINNLNIFFRSRSVMIKGALKWVINHQRSEVTKVREPTCSSQ